MNSFGKYPGTFVDIVLKIICHLDGLQMMILRDGS